MGAYFTAAQTPIGWRMTCAFSNETFAEHDAAIVALQRHHTDGCALSGWTARHGNDPDAAAAFAASHPHGWDPDWCVTSTYLEPVFVEETSPVVQVSHGNQAVVMDALGLTGDDRFAGSMSADDLLGRVLLAQGINPTDAGTDDLTYGGTPGEGPRTLVIGRRVGYVDDKLTGLRELAEWARARDLRVRWS